MKFYIYLIILLILVGGGIFAYRAITKTSANKATNNTASPSSSTSAPTQNVKDQISISNFAFQPSTLTVNTGTTVKFVNNDSVTHDVVANDNSFNSGRINPGASFSEVFTKAGTYQYHCSIHPSMHGTIIVQ